MKKRRFLLILIPLVIACGCLLACIKYARMKQEMVDKGFRLIVKIEQYQKEHKRLPNNLRPLDIKMLPSGTHGFEGRKFRYRRTGADLFELEFNVGLKKMTYYSGLRMWTSDEQRAMQLLEQKENQTGPSDQK